jgi:N-acetylmuramoyl-L-alanine amidase
MDRPINDWYLIVLLALATWREARSEGMDGMRAVMHVIRNRHLIWRQDWDTVIAGRNQFSSMAVKGDSQLILWPDDDAPVFRSILGLAVKVFDGLDADNTSGALYYWNPKTATSPWFVDNVAKAMPKVAVIGNHEFFRPGGGPPVSG